MAFIQPWTPEQEARHTAWIATRPPVVRALAERLHPNKLYWLKTTNQRVAIFSIWEDGTVTVRVLGLFNCLPTGDRDVFGIKPVDLEECELPDPATEPLGSDVFPPDVVRDWYAGQPACFLCGRWTDRCAATHPDAKVVKRG